MSVESILGIRHPIIQAPMAGVSTPALAASVSNAGGLGSLGLGASSTESARQAIQETRAQTESPFQANFFCHQPAQRDAQKEARWIEHFTPLFEEIGLEPPEQCREIYTSFRANDDMLRVVLETRPPIVSFHFGLPTHQQLQAIREAGLTTIANATSLDEARVIEKAGIDILVAQGIEAGGHRGVFEPEMPDERLSTSVLVRLLVRETTLPVVAAGGIMDGSGVRAALSLGAVAAQLGTAFVLCPESAANDGYRQNLRGERAHITRLTSTLSGRPARGLLNRFIIHGEASGSPKPAAYPVAYDLAKQLHAEAARQGIHDFAAHWAGQGAPLARELPAAVLMEELVREMG
ncbi:MAG: nitronate monooxygenase [Candidatus Eremiobacteraeota bacterium]|nr:nitronate monooxygenase [Candidatus Eremiobacteraeota bacterium]